MTKMKYLPLLALLMLVACVSPGVVPIEGAFESVAKRVVDRTEAFVAADDTLSDEDRAAAEAEILVARGLLAQDEAAHEAVRSALDPVMDRHDAYVALIEDEIERDIYLESTARIRSILDTVAGGAGGAGD